MLLLFFIFFFFFNDTATTEIYTLSLHDALPIFPLSAPESSGGRVSPVDHRRPRADRKSTRLNSSHLVSSYAVFCLKKKKHIQQPEEQAATEPKDRAINEDPEQD